MEIRVAKYGGDITEEEAQGVVAHVLPRVNAIDNSFFDPFVEQYHAGAVPLSISVNPEFGPWDLEPESSVFEVVSGHSQEDMYRVFFVLHPSSFLQYRRVYLGRPSEEGRDSLGHEIRPFTIFISYTTRDPFYWTLSRFIDRYLWELWQWLQVRGIDIFYARFSLPQILYRESDLEKILDLAIRGSVVFTAFITRRYAGSRWCRYEWESARSCDRFPITLSYVLAAPETRESQTNSMTRETNEERLKITNFLNEVFWSSPDTVIRFDWPGDRDAITVFEGPGDIFVESVKHTISVISRRIPFWKD